MSEHCESFGKSIFEALKSNQGDKTFMVDPCSKQELTFSSFLNSTIKLATTFRKLQLGHHDVISIVSQNNLQYFIPLLAGLYIGTPVNCSNPNYTESDLTYCFGITKPKVVISSKECLGKVENLQVEFGYKILVLDEGSHEKSWENLGKNLAKNEVEEFIPDDLDPKASCAVIFWSSGTTGLPKGVMLSHLNLRSTIRNIINPDLVGMKPKTITIGLLPFYHIFGLVLGISILFSEGEFIVLNKFKPDEYLQSIQDYKVTQLYCVPSLLLFLGKSPIVDQYNLQSVQEIFSAAAPCGKNIEHCLEKRFKYPIPIRQAYGLTETTGAITVTPKHQKIHGSVGKIMPGVQVKICDIKTLQKLNANEQGEICVKSDLVMMGYMGNPVETQDSIDGEGYLRTGDVGYYDEEGFLFIIDRIKELIKYKGFQVPPAQLEDLLVKHPAVKDAAVVGKPDERAGEVPVAFVVKQVDREVSEECLMEYISRLVSEERQLHGGVVFVEEIPRNPSGKILRRVLKENFVM